MTTMSNLATSDRILNLTVKEGEKPLNTIGMVDPRLITGGNTVHVVKDAQTNFWSFRYDQGKVPEALACKFTNFSSALKHATQFYKARNIEVTVAN